jgi:glycosyltransferase involved in cell wall biosynthesis
MYKVSVIVPIYNTGKYLERCINSILNQTYGNLEIILVNDGSTDDSRYICERFSRKYKHIKCINKKNTGVSDSRNEGINVAQGDLITFVDSDDVISEDMIEMLVELLEIENADLSICKIRYIHENNNYYIPSSNYKKFNFSREETLKAILNIHSFNIGPCGKIYKRKLLDNLRFESNLHINEDILFLFLYATRCDKTVYIDSEKYFYIRREGSASTSPFSKKNFDTLFVTQTILDLCKFTPSLIDNSIRFALKNYIKLANKIIYSNYNLFKDELKMVTNKIDYYRKRIKFSKHNFKIKIICFMICRITKLYIFMLKIFKKKNFLYN